MFKLIRQRYSTECGAACLAMVCNYYGVAYPLSQMGALCPSSADGVSMLSLQGVAKELGFDCFCTLADFGVLDNLAEPCILHWNQNHYVVFYGRKGNQYLIADPAKGKLRLSADRLKNYWLGDNDKGAIMLLQPTTEFGCLIKTGAIRYSFSSKISGALYKTILEILYSSNRLSAYWLFVGVADAFPNASHCRQRHKKQQSEYNPIDTDRRAVYSCRFGVCGFY